MLGCYAISFGGHCVVWGGSDSAFLIFCGLLCLLDPFVGLMVLLPTAA